MGAAVYGGGMRVGEDSETVARMWADAAAAGREFPACMVRRGGAWQAMGWAELGARVEQTAAGLMAAGVAKGDRVALLMGTRPEWTICDYALQSIGAVTVPLYRTASPSDATHVVSDCDARMVILEADVGERIASAVARAGAEVVVVGAAPEGGARSLDELAAAGRRLLEEQPRIVETAGRAVRADDVSSVVYTSGTTGSPKGCVLSHRNAWAMTDIVAGIPGLLFEGEVVLLFLPLAHSFARLMQNLAVRVGITIAYCSDLRAVPAALTEVRPHIMPSVPRAYELLQRQIAAQVGDARGPRKAAAVWAQRVGAEAERHRRANREISPLLRARYRLADRLVFARLRRRLGDRLRLAISGGAPLSPHVAEYLASVGLPVLEGYGLTEATCASHFNLPGPGRYRFGTVGRALPGVECRLAGDGEVQLHGPTVFAGYHARPEETRAVMTEDGWLRTGDLGEVDGDGFLRITGRKKDLIVTSGGENVPPLRIEAALTSDPLLSQALVLGDGRAYVVALLAVDRAEQHRRGLDDAATAAAVAGIVDRVNAGLSAYERVRRHAVLPREFTQEAGELTPTLKPRRQVCIDHNADVIAQLYSRREAS